MELTIEELERRRQGLFNRLIGLEEFRRGTISINYTRCGKAGCWCSGEKEKGHGPKYIWSTKVNGKTISKSLKLGPEAEKYLAETERYKKFIGICDELIEVNEKLCEAHPVRELESEEELGEMKKKLRRRLLRKRGRK